MVYCEPKNAKAKQIANVQINLKRLLIWDEFQREGKQ